VMKVIIYKDPGCSGLKSVTVNDDCKVEDALETLGISEDTCGGDTVYYVIVYLFGDHSVVSGSLDFT
jgi:hypothetical protein